MSTDPPLISIIVPVYNVKQYVIQCVESLIAQDYPNLEILLVDDGSTDSSGAICDRLAAEHACATVYHKENGGLSDARNYGLARSRGEWISFVDSDDYVSPIFISTLYAAAIRFSCPIAAVPGGKDFLDGDSCRLVEKICPVMPEALWGNHDERSSLSGEGDYSPRLVAAAALNAHEILEKMLYQQIATGAQWRLYRRDTLGKDPFPKGLYYEDLASTYKFVHRAGKVALVNCRELYAYRLRNTSIIRQPYRHIKGYSAVTVAAQLYHDVGAWYPDLAVACSSRCFSVCRMVFGQVPMGKSATDQDRDDLEALWKVIEANRNVVAADPDARFRERLAANIARLGEGCFVVFCHLARRLGKMQ
jgi:glycosyltransferase involved in cell wall biosynthesis